MSLRDELWVQLHPGNREMWPEAAQLIFFHSETAALMKFPMTETLNHRHLYYATQAKSVIP